MKRALLLLCVCLILMVVPGTALADSSQSVSEDPRVSLRYTYINYVAQSLDISAAGNASMAAEMQCTATIDKTRISAYLQRYSGGWESIAHWSKTSYSDECSWSQSYYVTSGYSYRLYVYYYAYIDDSVVESTTQTSYDSY